MTQRSDIERAAHELWEQTIGAHTCSWINCIATGSTDDGQQPAILVFLRKHPIREPEFYKGWQGYPVVVKWFGEFAPLGPVDD